MVNCLNTHEGFDFFMNADYGGGADKIIESLEGAGYEVDYIPKP